MKKILCFIISLFLFLITSQCYAYTDWSVSHPATADQAADIGTLVSANNAALDTALANLRDGAVITYTSTSTLSVSAGEVTCSNVDGSVRHFRQNTSATSVGWANIDALIQGAASDGKSFNYELIENVVDGSDKKRFAISCDGLYIRAVQGHSTESVDRSFPEQTPPEILYHGTATRFLESIKDQMVTDRTHYISNMHEFTAAQNDAMQYLKVISRALPPTSPTGPSMQMTMLVGMFCGFFFSIIYVLLMAYYRLINTKEL